MKLTQDDMPVRQKIRAAKIILESMSKSPRCEKSDAQYSAAAATIHLARSGLPAASRKKISQKVM